MRTSVVGGTARAVARSAAPGVVRDAARGAVHASRRRLGTVRLRRLLAQSPPPYRLELGAGAVRRQGWIGTDVAPNARYQLDATACWPFPPESISHLYADNMIEHVPLDGARSLLREARRKLLPGARLRLVTPDVRECAKAYLEHGEMARALVDAHRGAGTRMEHFVDVLRAVYIEYDHYRGYAWDFEALGSELDAAGFTAIERCQLQCSRDPVLCDLESRVLPVDRVTMLAVEAERP